MSPFLTGVLIGAAIATVSFALTTIMWRTP